jgi:predicted ATP-grasp superfamily ATP-dependent carboligase
MDKKRPIVYITRDIERALGVNPSDSYIVVSNDNAQGRKAKNVHSEGIILIADARGTLDTFGLMSLPQIANEIEGRDANVVVFQNNPRIERLAIERGWRLVNPLAELAKKIEEKVSQVGWLNEDAKLLPPHTVAQVKDVSFEGKKFVLQFNHSHTGQGTFVIESAGQLADFKAKFPNRECRIVDFVEGPVFTLNVVVGETETVLGATSYQITGLPPFTDLPFSTIGNDWGLPRAILSEGERGAIDHIARIIAERMRRDGWRGLFGIDVVQDAKTRDIFLLEINARQPASAVFESTLQRGAGISPTIFETHIAALTGGSLVSADTAGRISDGAQIVSRVTKEPRAVDTQALSARGLSVTAYENAEHNKELFRIQSNKGIMSAHNTPGELGTFIRSCIQ